VYLMISTYSKPLEEVDAVRDDHLVFLDGLEKRGLVVSAGRQDPPVGGVIIFNVDTEAEAQELIAGDPYVRAGVAAYTPTGFKPSRGVLAGWKAPSGDWKAPS
jgi:uncharacterized protein YciI